MLGLNDRLNYTDEQQNKVLDTSGEWSMVWFIIVVFAGAFYMVNLTFPVVALAYYEEVRLAALVINYITN